MAYMTGGCLMILVNVGPFFAPPKELHGSSVREEPFRTISLVMKWSLKHLSLVQVRAVGPDKDHSLWFECNTFHSKLQGPEK